jgi:hypothetical protein
LNKCLFCNSVLFSSALCNFIWKYALWLGYFASYRMPFCFIYQTISTNRTALCYSTKLLILCQLFSFYWLQNTA